MGLLDGLLGQVMGGMLGGAQTPGAQAQGQNPLLQIALQMLQQNGGLAGVLGKMQQLGYGEQAQSWVGTGRNMPIDPSVLSQIFGEGQLGALAQQFGMSRDEASGGLAQMLPDVVDRMTPQGNIPDNHSDLVNEALAILQKQR
jgi:uncharacterized protein YidB (DUF937 family)